MTPTQTTFIFLSNAQQASVPRLWLLNINYIMRLTPIKPINPEANNPIAADTGTGLANANTQSCKFKRMATEYER